MVLLRLSVQIVDKQQDDFESLNMTRIIILFALVIVVIALLERYVNSVKVCKKYVLDTNIFNRIVEGKLSFLDLPSDGKFFASNIQLQELNNTKCKTKQRQLIRTFEEIGPTLSECLTTLWGRGVWGQGSWSQEGDYYKKILADLQLHHKPKKLSSDINDALIGEISITEKCTLISTDRDLLNAVSKLGGSVRFLDR